MSDLMGAAASALRSANSVTLACHVGPDGDALGSMLGLAIAIENAGKKAFPSFGSPFSVPGSLSFLPVDRLVPIKSVPEEPEVMVVLDAGSADRLGELAEQADSAETLIVLDHHVTNDGFGDIAIVEPAAAATGELVHRLLGELGWEVTEEIAMCLLTALMTDTGRFQYSNTTPETHRIAADLMASGADPVPIGQHVYEESPFGYLAAAGAALSRASLDTDAGVVHTSITHEDLDRAGIDWGDIDHLIDTVRLAIEADVALLAKVHEDGRVKVSLRSRGATDVGSLAADLGGGGHRLAAGFTLEADVEDVIAQVISKVEEYR